MMRVNLNNNNRANNNLAANVSFQREISLLTGAVNSFYYEKGIQYLTERSVGNLESFQLAARKFMTEIRDIVKEVKLPEKFDVRFNFVQDRAPFDEKYGGFVSATVESDYKFAGREERIGWYLGSHEEFERENPSIQDYLGRVSRAFKEQIGEKIESLSQRTPRAMEERSDEKIKGIFREFA